MTRDLKIKDVHCPYCGEKNDAYFASDKNNNPMPKKGDLSICIYCLRFSTYDEVGDKFTLVTMTMEEQDNILLKHPEVQYALDQAKSRQLSFLLARELKKRGISVEDLKRGL
jgi:hypothetical protein